MKKRRPFRGAVLLALCMGAACGESRGSVVGRWRRADQPQEWVQFDRERTFRGRSFMDSTEIRGRWEQRGATVTVTSAYGHTRTLTVDDSVLVMQDGTRFQRVDDAP